MLRFTSHRLTPDRVARTGSFAVALIAVAVAVAASDAQAFPQILSDWQARYGAISASGDTAGCQLCHANASGGSPWNGYGIDIQSAIDDAGCDTGGDGVVSHAEAFYCVETQNADGDGSGHDNLFEIGVSRQPGWTEGPNNTFYTVSGEIAGQLPPSGIGPVDPDGTEPPPVVEPPPPGEDEPLGRPRKLQVVRPGQSIQRAIDRAAHGGRIFVLPGVYHEIGDPINGLNISRSDIELIGLGTKKRPVVLENAGNQRNGIVVVPSDRQDCTGCHANLAPPFELHPWVEPGMGDPTPVLYDVEIRNLVIRNFTNNGLFTERVDGFRIHRVVSDGNKNYGIFPTLSRNGVISQSEATGADDSGIWVETSQNVRVVKNRVYDNTNGFEVSNSDDIVLEQNVAHGNTSGFAILLLPDIFDDRPGAKRITLRKNWVFSNNRANTARPGSILATVPSGIGILHLGVDDSTIEANVVAHNDFGGIGVVDYCLAVLGGPFACDQDPTITPEFLADQGATGNRVVGNVLMANGTNPDPSNPFASLASDLLDLAQGEPANCYADNEYETFFSLAGELNECADGPPGFTITPGPWPTMTPTPLRRGPIPLVPPPQPERRGSATIYRN